MDPATVLPLSKPISADLLTVGQFLPNPLAPTTNPFISKSTSRAAHLRRATVKAPYKSLVSLETNVFSPTTRALVVEADEMEYCTLKRPSLAFDRICSDPQAQKWLRQMAARRQPIYFVTGIQKLKNGKVRRAVINRDGDVKVNETARPATQDSGIFGVEVRKVQCRIGRSDEPHLVEDIHWSWSYHKIKGANVYDERQLSVGLGEVVRAEDLGQIRDEDTDLSDGSFESSEED